MGPWGTLRRLSGERAEMGSNVGKEAENRTVQRLGGLQGRLAPVHPTSPGAQSESRSSVEKAPAGRSLCPARETTDTKRGAREEGKRRGGGGDRGGDARGARGGGAPVPSAWVRGRGVRLEAPLLAPMIVQLAGRLGRAFLQFTLAPGPPRARTNQTPVFA